MISRSVVYGFEKVFDGWNRDGNGTDVYAFSALSAGYGGSLNYSDAGYSAGFWGSSENYDGNLGYNITLDNYKVANQNYDSKLNGFSVRCVKD